MSTLRAVRESLVEASRRHSRVAHEVEDLAHDIVVSALRRGTPLDGETFLCNVQSAVRRHGAFLARTAGRRRAREMRSADVAGGDDTGDDLGADGAPPSTLSPTLQTTLFLLVLGLEKAELRVALGVTDAALRKRFQALREHSPVARPDIPIPTRTPALSELRRSQVKLLPRLTVALGGHARRTLAAGDPDGHGLIFIEALTPGRRTATPGTSAVKGDPCSTPRSRTSPSSS
ncbi:MAG: hypothetical protein KIT84_26160 [Labilithrix sp.]|nr:hypothetical protein [Labilithrix sp.]MCW5814540.1 hypothetical protein [Labilithrix sp.]